MDVSIEGQINGRAVRVVIECKDFDLRKTGPVGRPFVDAFDSERHDLGVGRSLNMQQFRIYQ